MSEVINKLRRMLAQAQGFAEDAPLEALARARLAVQEARAAAAAASGAEREELEGLATLAERRVAKYEARLAEWTASVQARAAAFEAHERESLQRALPAKV